jgi:hypothetical protein
VDAIALFKDGRECPVAAGFPIQCLSSGSDKGE